MGSERETKREAFGGWASGGQELAFLGHKQVAVTEGKTSCRGTAQGRFRLMSKGRPSRRKYTILAAAFNRWGGDLGGKGALGDSNIAGRRILLPYVERRVKRPEK